MLEVELANQAPAGVEVAAHDEQLRPQQPEDIGDRPSRATRAEDERGARAPTPILPQRGRENLGERPPKTRDIGVRTDEPGASTAEGIDGPDRRGFRGQLVQQ